MSLVFFFHLTSSITEGNVLEQCYICEDSHVCTLNMCYLEGEGKDNFHSSA